MAARPPATVGCDPRPRGRTRLIAGTALAVLASLGVGCGRDRDVAPSGAGMTTATEAAPVEPLRAGPVLVIGDSVVSRSRSALASALPEADLEVVAVEGARTADMLPLAREALAAADDDTRVVVLLGHNDARVGRVDDPAVEDLAELVDGRGCAIWLAIPTAPGGVEATADDLVPTDLARDWNRRTPTVLAGRGSVRWDTAWADQVDGPAGLDLVGRDRVHPTAAGRVALAATVRAALVRCS